MTGARFTAPAVKPRTVYLIVAALLLVTAAGAPTEAKALAAAPVGIAALIAIGAGFVVRGSTALTPWALMSGALLLYAVSRMTSAMGWLMEAAQLICLATAAVVGMFQLRVPIGRGRTPSISARTRWGSVLVAGTLCAVAIGLRLSSLPVLQWITRGSTRGSQERAEIASDYGRPVKLGRLQDPSITESSGLAASRANPGLLWTHNDSGHDPLVYCIDTTGASCGTWTVTGAHARDWEDIAVGPGPVVGESYLYIGDIGDNGRTARTVTIYRIPEPHVDPARLSDPGRPHVTAAADALQLRYPDGPHDAETLLVHPFTGDLYVVSKEVVSGVYKAPAPVNGSTITTLDLIAELSIFANLSDRTGGAISPDGRRVALSTYGGAFELVLDTSARTPFDSIWSQTPTRIASTSLAQLEAITYGADGRGVFMTGEGPHSPIFEVRNGS